MALERCTERACFGCGACVAACPKDAITLVPGEGGFLYPKLDAARCVRCGRCDAVCPIDAEGLTHPPKQAYAAWADEPTRASSTSGGAFSAIARTILKQGGAVCGAELLLPEGRVRHVCVEDESGLARLRKSKYVQSETAPALRDALARLRRGQRVLFVGTPCQVAGWRRLTAPFGDLAPAIDLVCGGVPSPALFQRYLREEETRAHAPITDYDFRDKHAGWNFPRIRITFTNGKTVRRIPACDLFFAGYSKKLTIRQTCFECPFCTPTRVGDLTIADCWRVATTHPHYDDNRGTSLILATTACGERLLSEISQNTFIGVYNLDRAIATNTPLRARPKKSPARQTVLQAANPCLTLRKALGHKFFIRGFIVWWVRRLGWFWFRRRQ